MLGKMLKSPLWLIMVLLYIHLYKINKSEKRAKDKKTIKLDRESKSHRGSRWICVLAWTAKVQVVWGQSVCGALVVFQPINLLHIFNPVRCAAGEEHWRMYSHYSVTHIREKEEPRVRAPPPHRHSSPRRCDCRASIGKVQIPVFRFYILMLSLVFYLFIYFLLYNIKVKMLYSTLGPTFLTLIINTYIVI